VTMSLKVFVDFDGTVTKNDVGNEFFRHFGGPSCEVLVEQYRRGELTAQECFRREAAAIGSIRSAALDEFLDGQEIDPQFPGFLEFCRNAGVEVCIVSDGLDEYIRRVLRAKGIGDVPFFSNVLLLGPPDVRGRSPLEIRFPNSDPECGICASCKRNIMLNRAGEEDVIAYVGEGFSDQCPVRYADIVFAKDELQAYCQRENISYYLYASFDDVTARLKELTSRRRVRKRRRAEQRRREVFRSEP